MTASRKVGGAVVRNLVRRRMREIFRTQIPAMQTGWDTVVIVRPDASKLGFEAIRDELHSAWRKLGMLP